MATKACEACNALEPNPDGSRPRCEVCALFNPEPRPRLLGGAVKGVSKPKTNYVRRYNKPKQFKYIIRGVDSRLAKVLQVRVPEEVFHQFREVCKVEGRTPSEKLLSYVTFTVNRKKKPKWRDAGWSLRGGKEVQGPPFPGTERERKDNGKT